MDRIPTLRQLKIERLTGLKADKTARREATGNVIYFKRRENGSTSA